MTDPPASVRNGYRYSDRFIRVWTIVLCAIVVIFPIIGIVLLATSDSEDPQPVGLAMLIGGIAIPLLAGAVLGGNAIRRGGGWVGVVFFLGFAGTIAGVVLVGWIWWPLVVGIVLLAPSVVGFWAMGRKAGVPMWLQFPFIGSPRLHIQRGEGDEHPGGHEA